MNEQLSNILGVLHMGMRVLNERLFTAIALVMTFSLFVYCVIEPDIFRIVAATLFALIVFLPMRKLEKPKALPIIGGENGKEAA